MKVLSSVNHQQFRGSRLHKTNKKAYSYSPQLIKINSLPIVAKRRKTLERNFCPRSMPTSTHRYPSQQEEGSPSDKWTQQQEADVDLISSHSSPPTSRPNSLLHSSSRVSSLLTTRRPTCENSTSIPRSIGQEVRIMDPCLRVV